MNQVYNADGGVSVYGARFGGVTRQALHIFAAKKQRTEMEMKITLPGRDEWDSEENYAVNLRGLRGGGCAPVGIPQVAVADAGAACVALGDRLLTVSDDRHDLFIDGEPAGSLGSPFVSMLADGDGAIIFTPDGPEWLLGGKVQGGAPDGGAQVSAESSDEVSAQVILPELQGSYPRSEGAVTAADVPAMTGAVRETLALLEAQARRTGGAVQPLLAGWRLVDVAGRTVASGGPALIGLGVQGSGTLQFSCRHTGSTFEITGSALVRAVSWRLRVSVGRSASDFWRAQVARLEVLAVELPELLAGVTGRFNASGSQASVLNLTPVMDAEGAERRAREAFARSARVVATVESPLEGFEGTLTLTEGSDDGAAWGDSGTGNFTPSGAWRFGSMTVYTLSGEPGTLLTAPSADPLRPVGRERVSQGRIMALTSPVGSGGGWNYGRHHLLAFATDGIYGVSVDRSLGIITSTLLHQWGVERSDAVAVTPSAVYAATQRGMVLRLRGSRAEVTEMPFAAVALTYVAESGELWILGADGSLATMDGQGRCTLRTDLSVRRFVAPGVAIDTSNAARALGREGREAVEVGWCRGADMSVGGMLRCRWRLASPMVSGLRLRLLAHSGGASQRLLELRVDGKVNAPVSAVFASPRRLRIIAELRGTASAGTRLLSVRV